MHAVGPSRLSSWQPHPSAFSTIGTTARYYPGTSACCSRLAACTCPCRCASSRALLVSPHRPPSRRRTSAPADSSAWTTEPWPHSAARCSGVSRVGLAAASTEAPASTRAATAGAWPCEHHHLNSPFKFADGELCGACQEGEVSRNSLSHKVHFAPQVIVAAAAPPIFGMALH